MPQIPLDFNGTRPNLLIAGGFGRCPAKAGGRRAVRPVPTAAALYLKLFFKKVLHSIET
jgi:hypothetical protein